MVERIISIDISHLVRAALDRAVLDRAADDATGAGMTEDDRNE
ncbi:hypothetical protein [Microbacterium sp.]